MRPLPAGADAIVQVEQTDGGTETVRDQGRARGRHARAAGGEDVAGGRRRADRRAPCWGPRRSASRRRSGAPESPVRRRPVVLVLSTGIGAGRAGRAAAARPDLRVERADARGRGRGRGRRGRELLRFVPDDVAHSSPCSTSGAPGVDLVLTSGGVSAGAYEVVKDALAGRGVSSSRSRCSRAARRARAGRAAACPSSRCPGNPVSSQVSFEVFVRPALRAALGHPHPERPGRRRPAGATADLAVRTQAVPARRARRRAGTVAEVGGPPSHLLGATGPGRLLLRRPRGGTELLAGAEVDVWLLDG